MTGNGFYRKGWLLPILIFCGVAILAGVIALFVWQVGKSKDTQRSLIASNHHAIVAEKMNRKLADAQISFGAYVFCRSEGRSPKACKRVAKAVLLPAKVDVQKLTAQVAELGEARIEKLMVGPPGHRGKVGAGGGRGLRGRDGHNGKNGAPGLRGLKGDTGAIGAIGPRGATGSQGPPGPPGPTGSPGIVCPGLHIVTITIPSSGTYKIPVCS